MKKIFTYIAIATALIATSCVQENLDGTSSEGQVSLELFCTDLETRAAGDDAFNENKITHFDYFFFSDAEGTTPIYDHARVIGDQKTFHTDKDEPFEKLSNGGYVYIVANYPGLIPASVKTLAQVLELPVSTDFQADYATKNANGFIMDNLGADGKLTQFKPTHAGEETTVKIGLSRLAVKTTLVINIAKEVAGIGEEIWRPVIDKDHLFVYFVNADKTNTMSATPMRRSEEPEGANPKDYFTYATTHGYTNKGEVTINGAKYNQIATDPSYTYPQAWTAEENGEPYYKIQLGWESSIKGMSPFYYKIPVPVPAKENVFTLNRNTWYQLTLTLKVLGGTEDDYVLLDKYYCVADFADWSSPSESFGTTSDSAHYFDVPTLSYNIYSANTLDINFICDASATALAEITSIEYYDYSGSGADLISRTPANGSYAAAQSSTSYRHDREGRIYSLEVNDAGKDIRFTHDISDLYVVRTIKVRVYKSTERNIYRDVTIQQHPAIELKKAADANGNLLAEDLFVNGYFASVRNSADEFGSTRDGDGYYHCRTGWSSDIVSGVRGISANTIGYGNLVHIDDIDWVSKPFFMTDISISAFSENNKYYKIKVNDANEETVYYRVGDPRLKASDVFPEWSLYPYLFNNGGNEDFTGWERPGEIKVTSKDNLARNIIAPHFLVSSGATEEITNSYDETPPDEYMPYVKRAATYQEAGYPAGRWRLPTEAEIAFIAARQRDKTLPTIFNVDVTYFAASGRFVIIPSDGSDLLFFSEDRLDDTFTFGKYRGYTYRSMIDAKFVYDLWYWGTEPMAANVYHPNQHIEN